MELHPRKRQRRRAEVEHYINSIIDNSVPEQLLYLEYSAMIADVSDIDHLPDAMPEAVRSFVIEHREAFIRFLRTENRAVIQESERAQERFAELRPDIQRLRAKIEQGEASSEFLGRGLNNSVYRLDTIDGSYAVKFNGVAAQTNYQIRPLLRVQGLPHVAQLEAYDMGEDNVTVMNLMPGRDMTFLREDPRLQIMSDEQFIALVNTITTLTERGIVIDPKVSNFLLDPREGVSVLDFALNAQNVSAGEQIAWMIASLSTYTSSYQAWRDSEPDYFGEKEKQRSIMNQRIWLSRLEHMLRLLVEHFPARQQEMIDSIRHCQQNPNVRGCEMLSTEHLILDDPEIRSHYEQLRAFDDPEIPWLIKR